MGMFKDIFEREPRLLPETASAIDSRESTIGSELCFLAEAGSRMVPGLLNDNTQAAVEPTVVSTTEGRDAEVASLALERARRATDAAFEPGGFSEAA